MRTRATSSTDLEITWDVHDVWTEAYVGVRHVIYSLLPPPGRKLTPELLALCQLGLIGANHLLEVGLYRFLQGRPAFTGLSESKKTRLRKA